MMSAKYWVIFPQSVEIYDDREKLSSNFWRSSSSVIYMKGKKNAQKVLEILGGAYIEKIEKDDNTGEVYCTEITTRSEDSELDTNQLYDKYSEFPPVKAVCDDSRAILFDALNNLDKFIFEEAK